MLPLVALIVTAVVLEVICDTLFCDDDNSTAVVLIGSGNVNTVDCEVGSGMLIVEV